MLFYAKGFELHSRYAFDPFMHSCFTHDPFAAHIRSVSMWCVSSKWSLCAASVQRYDPSTHLSPSMCKLKKCATVYELKYV